MSKLCRFRLLFVEDIRRGSILVRHELISTVAAVLFGLCCLFWQPGSAVADPEADEADEWVSLPESGRAAFAGVHGGTAPVSVLSSEKNPVKAAVPGRGGQDFIAAIQGEDSPEENSDLVPFGLADTPALQDGNTHLARLDQERQNARPRGASRIKVDDLKVVPTDAPVSPESLLMLDELPRM